MTELTAHFLDEVEVYNAVQRTNEALIFEITVLDQNDQPKDLTGATSRFRVSDLEGNPVIDLTVGSGITIAGSKVETKFTKDHWNIEPGLYSFYHDLTDPTDGPGGLLQGEFQVERNLMDAS